MKKSVSIVVGFQVIIAALLQIAKIPRVKSSDYYFCNMYSEYKIFQSRFQLCKISFGFYVGRLRCRHFKEMQNLCQLPFITKDKCGIHIDTNQDQITYYIKLTQIVAAVRTFKKIDAVASNTASPYVIYTVVRRNFPIWFLPHSGQMKTSNLLHSIGVTFLVPLLLLELKSLEF